jgi:hypothetical protein
MLFESAISSPEATLCLRLTAEIIAITGADRRCERVPLPKPCRLVTSQFGETAKPPLLCAESLSGLWPNNVGDPPALPGGSPKFDIYSSSPPTMFPVASSHATRKGTSRWTYMKV